LARFAYCHTAPPPTARGRLKRGDEEDERERGTKGGAIDIAVYDDHSDRETDVACLALILFRLFFTTIFLRIGLESIGWPGKYGVRPDASRCDKNSRGLKNDPPRRKIETATELPGAFIGEIVAELLARLRKGP